MSRVRPAQPSTPPTPKGVLCPYCGRISANPRRCDGCAGFFDPLSRQATQNAMGPWFIRDTTNPFRPGCSYDMLRELIKRGKVKPDTILRGPTTRQFWNFAARTPTVAHLLGICHNCHAKVSPDDYSCASCGAVFTPETDRQHLGLAPVHLLPGQASPEIIAAASVEQRVRTGGRTPHRRAGTPGSPELGRSAIEPETTGGGFGKTIAIVGILVALAAAGVGAVVLSKQLAVAGASAAAPEQTTRPAETITAPSPGTGQTEASSTVALSPTSESPSITPGQSEAPEPPAATTSAEPTSQPPREQAPSAATAELVKLLADGVTDQAQLAAALETVRTENTADTTAWQLLVDRRIEQLRLRGLP